MTNRVEALFLCRARGDALFQTLLPTPSVTLIWHYCRWRHCDIGITGGSADAPAPLRRHPGSLQNANYSNKRGSTVPLSDVLYLSCCAVVDTWRVLSLNLDVMSPTHSPFISSLNALVGGSPGPSSGQSHFTAQGWLILWAGYSPFLCFDVFVVFKCWWFYRCPSPSQNPHSAPLPTLQVLHIFGRYVKKETIFCPANPTRLCLLIS